MTAADIARLAGVGRAAVSNWRKRHEDFPQPVGGTATSPSFSLSEVQDWLSAQGRLPEAASDEHLWQELRGIADRAELADVLAYAGAFLLFLHREPKSWARLADKTDAKIAATLPRAVRDAAKGIPGERAFPSEIAVEHVRVIRGVAALATERSPREAFEFLRERYLDLHKRRMYETPPTVVRLALGLAGHDVSTVLDPSCGSGSFLLGALESQNPPKRLLGQDVDVAMVRLTALRLALRTSDAQVRAGDSLRHDAFADVEADLVATAPPFNDRNWGFDELTADPRWEYGLPPRTEPELAWVQHALAHCRPSGLAVVLMPPAAADRRAGRRVRAQLLRRGALRAVFALPQGAVPNTAVPLALWVLRRPAPGERPPGQVLMVDTSVAATAEDDYSTLALRSWRSFSDDPEGELDDPGVGRAVRIIDLLDEEVDLTPARHIAPPAAAPAIERVREHQAQVTALLEDLTDLVPAVEPTHAATESPLHTVAELARMGLLTIHQAAPKTQGENHSDPPDIDTLVLTAKDVLSGGPPSGTGEGLGGGDERLVRLRSGDVVVPAIVRSPAARVVAEPGAVLGRQLFLLRPDPERLDPHFLAGVLRGSSNLRHYSVMSSSFRVDVRRAEVPLPSIAEQRLYGDVFRRLDRFATELRRASELGIDLARLVGDGLVDGSLRPDPADARDARRPEPPR